MGVTIKDCWFPHPTGKRLVLGGEDTLLDGLLIMPVEEDTLRNFIQRRRTQYRYIYRYFYRYFRSLFDRTPRRDYHH